MKRFSVRVTPSTLETRHLVDAETAAQAETYFRQRVPVRDDQSVFVWLNGEKFKSEHAGYKGWIGWR